MEGRGRLVSIKTILHDGVTTKEWSMLEITEGLESEDQSEAHPTSDKSVLQSCCVDLKWPPKAHG